MLRRSFIGREGCIRQRGMVMERLGVSIEVATIRLRGHAALAAGRPIGDVARDVMRRKVRLQTDGE